MAKPSIDNLHLLAMYVKKHPDRWQITIGQQVTNVRYGIGIVKKVEIKSETVYIEICFHNDTQANRKFTGDTLTNVQFFSNIDLPSNKEIDSLREQLQLQSEKELEEQNRKDQEYVAVSEFANLKIKYCATSCSDISPASALCQILYCVEAGETLNENQLAWLTNNRLNSTLAIYFQNEYKKSREAWDLVRASSYWRKDDQADKAIRLTDYLLKKHDLVDGKLKAAILTTRGGAFRDLGDLLVAEQCALEAIQCDKKSFQAYNLMGAIYFECGEAEKGENYFLHALKLGAGSRVQESQMQNALGKAGQVEQITVAKYLLERDSVKYNWARFYTSSIG